MVQREKTRLRRYHDDSGASAGGVSNKSEPSLKQSGTAEPNWYDDDVKNLDKGGGGYTNPVSLLLKKKRETPSRLDTPESILAQKAKEFLEAFRTAKDSSAKDEITRNVMDALVTPAPVVMPTIALPDEAPALWLERADRKQTPAAFIAREYAPWLEKGLTQLHIRRLDKSLYMALHKWLMHNDLPFDLPNQKQKNDRLLKAAGLPLNPGDIDDQTRERMRLHGLARIRILTPS